MAKRKGCKIGWDEGRRKDKEGVEGWTGHEDGRIQRQGGEGMQGMSERRKKEEKRKKSKGRRER